MRTLVVALASLVATSCVATTPSAYQLAAQLPTPSTLTPDSRWAIILLDEAGQVAGSLVVRLTDTPVKTCDSGEYRRLQVVPGQGLDGIPIHDPAYSVDGAALRIQLSSSLCDAGYAVIGGVSKHGFEGVHMPEVLFADRHSRSSVLRAYGMYLAN